MSAPLLPLSPRQQLTAGKLPRRLVQLLAGLWLFGASIGIQIRATLGLAPWDVFHQGVTLHTPLTYGQATIATGVAVLLLWIPLRQWPGLGTIANAVLVGVALDATLVMIEEPTSLPVRVVMLVAGVVLNGIAGALYIGSQLGPGPRDGLMTGIVQRTGWQVRWVMTALQVAVLLVGMLLGGSVGIGTVLYAFGVGPVMHAFLPPLTVDLRGPGADPAHASGPS